MRKIIAIASAAALGLGLAACDGGTEEAEVEAVDEVGTMEDTGQFTDDQGAMVGGTEDQAVTTDGMATDDAMTDTTTTDTTTTETTNTTDTM